MNLYQHQKQIITDNKLWTGIFQGTGSGKSRTALELAEAPILVICPKQQFLDKTWEKNAEKFDIKKEMDTISKETFRRDYLKLKKKYKTVIIDECHNMLGVLPITRQRQGIQIPKTSQMFEATYLYIKRTQPKRLYLCSATPVSKPMNMWAIATLMGEKWDFIKFRSAFYFKTLMGRREVWMPKKDEASRTRLADLVKRFGYTGALNDFVDVPEQTHKEVEIELTDEQKEAIEELYQNEADPLVRRGRQRTIENGVLYTQEIEEIEVGQERMIKKTVVFPSKKIDYILEKATEFPKMLIFANYTGQINEIAKALQKEGYSVSTLTGKTKDRGMLITNAEKSEAHIVIAQSGIAEGYELPSFPCVIYASKSWRYVFYEQSLGRVLRINKLKKNLYIHLVVKGADGDCHNTIMDGKDFQEKLSI